MITLALAALTLASAAQQERSRGADPYPVESLAVVMGELHAVAFRCEGSGSQTWRQAMMELLEHEAPTRGTYRDRLVRGFNDGFRFRDRQRFRCGAESELIERDLAERGRALSEQLRRTYLD